MGNIVLLDDLTINKIAAGEVIERPASVIKEMMENSIDAGATNLSVEIKNGGISYIRITDNGKGISEDDMEMAFERHATSKIRKADDLETVTSMGFRGEALASVAAIARVEMVSRTKEDEIGHKIVVEAGKILEKEEIGCPLGTTITVTNLFFNTPVRYKFLKKDFTESGYIEDVVTRIALVNTNVSIKLVNTGKTVISSNGNGQIKDVIYNIYGKDISQSVLDVDYEYEDIKITGVIGKPEIARSNRANQLFFVNNRFVKDKTLTSGAEQAFKGMLTIGKYGFLILNLSMNPAKVDVNVHPAKLEVRFEEEQKVFKAVYHAIKDTLLKGDLVTNTEKQKEEEQPLENEINYSKININDESKEKQGFKGLFSKFRKEEVEQVNNDKTNTLEDIFNTRQINVVNPDVIKVQENVAQDVFKQISQIKDNVDATLENKIESTTQEESKNYVEENKSIEEENIVQKQPINMQELLKKMTKQEQNLIPENFNQMYAKTFGKEELAEKEEQENTEKIDDTIIKYADIKKEDRISMFEEQEVYNKPKYKFIGIVFSTYIIIEIDNEMYIIDQHAAHERIMYEKVKANYYNDGEKDSQLMLLPDIITLTHKEMLIAKENMEMFEKAGFMLEEFGENTIKLTGVPNICLDLETRELFLETLDEINTVARTAKQEIEEKFIATVACKAAVKANMALTKEEVDTLMEKLLKLPNPFTCPHGRPTAIKMTKYDIEKKFSRR